MIKGFWVRTLKSEKEIKVIAAEDKQSMIDAERDGNLIVSAFYAGMYMRAVWVLKGKKKLRKSKKEYVVGYTVPA